MRRSDKYLPPDEVKAYRENGFLLQEIIFHRNELESLRREAQGELASDSPRRTIEEKSGVVRAVHGCHLYSGLFSRLVREPRLLLVARQLLDDDVYVYQFKINAKRAFKGEIWEWHQDYIFWHHEDGMLHPRAVTVAIFLDDVTEFNGPLVLVPKAHATGMINVVPKGEGMESALAADLKYALDLHTMRLLTSRYGLTAPKGNKGSVLWFDCNLPHGSAPNMSPFDRNLLLITYNAVSNALPVSSARPEWLIGRDATPLEPIEGPLEPVEGAINC